MKSNWNILHKGNIEDITDILLKNRGIPEDRYCSFLKPDINNLHDPLLLYDIDKAVDRILSAIKNKEQIFIYGDYDVDGVCATAILWEYLYYTLSANILSFIPSRFNSGYGLSSGNISALVEKGAKLIITVDCGITNCKLIDEFKDKVNFIITDHHRIPDVLPDCIVIHPDHPKGEYPFKNISGGVVAWKLVQAIKMKLNKINLEGLDLAAISTACDIMPLIDENRIIVKKGLEQIQSTNRAGLDSMLRESGLKNSPLDVYHLSFILGPRLNAAGRIKSAMDALRLLVMKDNKKSMSLAYNLARLNKRRQDLTMEILEIAEKEVIENQQDQKLLFVEGHDWPEGVIGLVAGKLTEKFHRPSIVVSRGDNKTIGSARSIDNFDITDALSNFRDCFKKFGGHPQAAGLTVKNEMLELFKSSIQKFAVRKISDKDLVSQMNIDTLLDFEHISFGFTDKVNSLSPFGPGNFKPIFVSDKVKIANIGLIGTDGRHLKGRVFKDDQEFEILGFGMGDKFTDFIVGDYMDIVYNIGINSWNSSRSIQLILKDYDVKIVS